MVPDITLDEYYMGRDKLYPEELTDAHRMNAQRTVDKANALLELFGEKRRCVSGWRPHSINAATKGAAPNSKHVLCMAIDLEDANKELKGFIMNDQALLERLDLYMEDIRSTPTWVHLQIKAPNSGKRIFYP